MTDMTREALLDLLTTAAQIGRNDDTVGRAQVRADVTEVVERRMKDQIDEVLAIVPPLVTLADLHALNAITYACIHGNKVARLIDGNSVVEGVARSIGDEHGNFLRRDEDVRNGYLRVSGLFEYFWPIRELMPQVHSSEFVVRRGES